MKPVYLEMNYFGPHEHSIIDFRKLEEAPIFLIGGDTGAGKSTIFDAMTFALFGSTTGDRDAKEMRSQFATPDEATSVIFYFEQGNNLYKIKRQPEQLLSKKRGTGLASNKSVASLSVVEEVGGIETQSIASKPMDVGLEIKDILNLNADQFKKIILLPQNDFSEFLKSNTADKEEILKKIFGTQIFSDFTDKLKNRYNDSKKKNEQFSNELQNQLESIAWTDEERDSLTHESDEGKVILLQKFVNQRNDNLTKANNHANDIAKSLSTADKKLQDAKNIKTKFARLDKLQNDFQLNIVDKKSDIADKRKHVTELDWANKLKDTIRDLAKDEKSYNQNLKDKNTLVEQLKTYKANFDSAKKALDNLNNQIDQFNSKKDKITELNTLIPQIKRLEELTVALSKLRPQVKQLEAEINAQNTTAKKLISTIENKQNNLVPINDLQNKKDTLTKQKEIFTDTLSPLVTERDNLIITIKQLENDLKDYKKSQQDRQSDLDIAKKIYDEKIGTRQSLMIAQLQQELSDGEPCVVCGSTVHPNIIHTVDADESELKKSMDEVDQSQKAYITATNKLNTVNENITKVGDKITAENIKLKSANNKLDSTYTDLTSNSKLTFSTDFDMQNIKDTFDTAIRNIDKDISAANKQIDEIKSLETEQKDSENELNTKNIELGRIKSEQETYQNELLKITQNINKDNLQTSDELNIAKNNLEQEIKTYQEQLDDAINQTHKNELELSNGNTKLDGIDEQLDKLNASLKASNQILSDSLNADDAKTSELAVLNAWISEVDNGDLSKLNGIISEYKKEKELLNADINNLNTELKDIKSPDIEHLQQTLSDLTIQNKLAVEKSTEAKLRFENAQSSYTKVQLIMSKQGDFAKKSSEITSLYNVITGKDGNDDKLKLETYVVRQYLLKVLNYANDHFINLLSNNRYTFEIAAKGSDKRSDHGLDINVYDNETGATRSSDTLSGGETFIAALSIALSLSEVVQSSTNGVQIDALFVDEGFGSLDHETLEKAMTALETIGENRMVGVISHIETMKSTIGQQVLIKKIGDGRSRVEIVNK
ncbi:SMC family ATPase [Companilactobacillus allii]|uniref:Nuclease SbcCD subunit C n=1 Tax=Companilactobacillus allii TaxID=1847728 RepID=A0A1P8Q1T3_9LACO|nr:SMC family ATPase [Companilactobacillus allii]APX71749.1 exonuclease SbcC [Companilactobacillus allii]USQ68836.1 SMC family ATPase [Companilactobacillus allii]